MTSSDRNAPLDERQPEALGGGGAPGWVTRLQEGPEYQRRFVAQLLMALLMFALSAVVEVSVPLLRFVLGRRGVQSGPAIGTLLAFVGGFIFTSRVDSGIEPGPVGSGPLALIKDRSLEIAAVGLPAIGALLPMTVVAPRRSPLMAWVLLPLPRIMGSFLLAWSIGRAKKRAANAP